MKRFFSLMYCLLLTGCTKYEYNLTQPRELSRHIGEDRLTTVAVEPLVYKFQTEDNRLIMLVQNPTHDPITLLGDRSVLIDPRNQSHPLPGQTIAPGTYIKFILPPFRPTYYNSGPTIGFGFGAVYGYRYGRGRGWFDEGGYLYQEPRYLTIYDPSNLYYFTWEGETDVRVTLTYSRADKTFQHAFTFHREKKIKGRGLN